MELPSTLLQVAALLSDISPAQWIQAVFVGCATAFIVLPMLPANARRILLAYGARSEVAGKDAAADSKKEKPDVLETLLATLAKHTQIPHSAFWHFYALSTTCSALWAWQLVTKGTLMRFLVEKQIATAGRLLPSSDADKATDLGRVFAAWAMLALQGVRRLYECMYVLKAGKSGMLLAHWVAGVVFYLLMSVAVWIDHAGELYCTYKHQSTMC